MVRLAGGLLFTTSLVGCSPSQVVVYTQLDPAREHLMKVCTAYIRYNTRYGKPPTGPDQLTPFLQELGSPAELLRSPRDGEPFVICWGVDLSTPQAWAMATPVLAYERRGADGKRYVLTTQQSIVLMTAQEFRQASFPPGHSPPH